MDIKQVYPTQSEMVSMTEQQQLLAAIITNRDEDTPRLMYCDWLDESGCTQNTALAGYIRKSIELHNHKRLGTFVKDDIGTVVQMKDNGYKLDSYKWYTKGIELSKEESELWKLVQETPYYFPFTRLKPDIVFETERGFIDSITCTATQFLSVCDKLVWHPSMKDTRRTVCTGCSRCVKGKRWVDWLGIWDNCNEVFDELIPRPCPLTAHPIREIFITGVIYERDTPKLEKWINEYAPSYDINMEVAGI